MKSFILIATFALTIIGLCYIGHESAKNLRNSVPTYDMYVFAVQWGKTLCVSGGSACETRLANIPKNHMSIHGLWPSLKSGSQISTCNTGTQVSIVDDGSSTFISARKYWPSLTGANTDFWNHEYNKHGYCYSNKIGNFDYKLYFKKALDVFTSKKINTLITDTFGTQSGEYAVSLSTLKSKLTSKLGGNYYALVCKTISSKQYLQEIRISLDLNFNYMTSSLSSSTCSSSKNVIIYYR